MHRFLLVCVALAAVGCPSNEDFDGDGFVEPADCNDADAAVYPDAPEVPYDRVDQDCDGADLIDVDGDGEPGEPANGFDCNDEDATVNPSAEEIPYDGVDQNCDGWNDDDFDQDGYEAVGRGGQDCDDFDPEIVPLDTDGDGFSPCTGDCDESDPDRNPLTTPVCGNKIDDNCDGVSDCALTGPVTVEVADRRIDGADVKGLRSRFGVALAAPGDAVGDAADDLIVASYDDLDATTGRVHWFEGPLSGAAALDDAVASVSVGGGDLHLAADGTTAAIAFDTAQGLGTVALFTTPPSGHVLSDAADLSVRHSAVLYIDPVTRQEVRSDQRMGDAVALLDGGATLAIGAKLDGCVVPDAANEAHVGACGTVNLLSTSLTGSVQYGQQGAMLVGDEQQRAGQSLHAFDYDGDGVDDLVVGSDGFDRLVPVDASLVLAPPSSGVHLLSDLASAKVDLRDWGDGLGGAATGDLDGDGTDDLVIGAPRFSGRTGGVAVFTRAAEGDLDPNEAEILRFAIGQDSFGQELLVEDLDGDGALDLIVGAPAVVGAGGKGEPGTVHVWYGPLDPGTEVSLQANLTISGLGQKERTEAGSSLAFTDVDGDGYGDLVAASPGEGAGAVYVFYGGATALGGI